MVLIVASLSVWAIVLGEAPSPLASVVIRVAGHHDQGWYAIEGYKDADECQGLSRLAKLTSASNLIELKFVAGHEVAIGIIYNKSLGSNFGEGKVTDLFGNEVNEPGLITKVQAANVILKFVPEVDGRYEIALDFDPAGFLHWKTSQQNPKGEWSNFNSKAVHFAPEIEGKLLPKITKSCKGDIPVVPER
jgi:hypothetical protein